MFSGITQQTMCRMKKCREVVPIEEDGERLHDGGLEGEDAREEAELVTMEEAGLAVLRANNAR
jgi:hypothetical protein